MSYDSKYKRDDIDELFDAILTLNDKKDWTFRRSFHLGQLLSDLGLILPSGKYDSFTHKDILHIKQTKIRRKNPTNPAGRDFSSCI